MRISEIVCAMLFLWLGVSENIRGDALFCTLGIVFGDVNLLCLAFEALCTQFRLLLP